MKDLEKKLEAAKKEFEEVAKSYEKATATVRNLEQLGLKIQGKIETYQELINGDKPKAKVVDAEVVK